MDEDMPPESVKVPHPADWKYYDCDIDPCSGTPTSIWKLKPGYELDAGGRVQRKHL